MAKPPLLKEIYDERLKGNIDAKVQVDTTLEEIHSVEDMLRKMTLFNAGASPGLSHEEEEKILNDPQTPTRFITKVWPRNPDGPAYTPRSSLPGFQASKHFELWGASLLDFYRMSRFPSNYPVSLVAGPSVTTTSTSSKLYRWVKNTPKELAWDDLARNDFMELAARTKMPHEVEPWSTGQAIFDYEVSMRKMIRENDPATTPFKDDAIRFASFECLPSSWPHGWPYPDGWIHEPFNPSQLPPLLEEYMPQKHLPISILVHDPWGLLSSDAAPKEPDVPDTVYASEDPPESDASDPVAKESETLSWNAKVAELEAQEERDESSLPSWVKCFVRKDFPAGEARRREDDKRVEKERAKAKEIYDVFLKNPHSNSTRPKGCMMMAWTGRPSKSDLEAIGGISEPIPAAYYILYPLPPENPWPSSLEANVYIHPNHKKGVGHHSAAYSVEMELPRIAFISPLMICQPCVNADALKQLEEGLFDESPDLKGRWVIKGSGNKAGITMLEDEKAYWIDEDTYEEKVEYQGPFRVIKSRVPWKNPVSEPIHCMHNGTLWSQALVGLPRSCKFRVVSKMETVKDGHLQREAENYQSFPEEFFTRYSGYHLVDSAIQRPTPVGPLVPQFYGYYEPEEEEEEEDDQVEEEGSGGKRWNSPLLLVEDCGTPIWESKLDSTDEKDECAALIFRLHAAGYMHGSVFTRNIMRKPGPIAEDPATREANKQKRGGIGVGWDYRLIDFGRTEDMGKMKRFKDSENKEEAASYEDMRKRRNDEYQKLNHWVQDWPNTFHEIFDKGPSGSRAA